MPKHYHVLMVRRSSGSSMVVIRSDRFEQSIRVPYDYSMSSIAEVAVETLRRLGYKVVGYADMGKGYAIITDTWEGPQDMVRKYKIGARRMADKMRR